MQDLVYAWVFAVIMVLGLSLNAVSLWILLRRHNLTSSNAVFMVNLAVSDLLLVITLPFRIYLNATGSWPLGSGLCVFVAILFRNNIHSSVIFITFISVDRLLAVVYPLRSRHLRGATNAWKGAAVTWFLVAVLSIPESLGFSRNFKKHNVTTCFESVSAGIEIKPTLRYLHAVFLLAMLVVNMVCTAMVSWTLRKRDTSFISNRVNVMLIFVLNLIMFIVCFVPLSLGLLVSKISNIGPLICISYVNCCLDPILYYFSFDAFWKKKEVDMSRDQQTKETNL